MMKAAWELSVATCSHHPRNQLWFQYDQLLLCYLPSVIDAGYVVVLFVYSSPSKSLRSIPKENSPMKTFEDVIK